MLTPRVARREEEAMANGIHRTARPGRVAESRWRRAGRALSPRRAWRFAMRVFDSFWKHGSLDLGAALSYYTMFSIVPLLVVIIGISGLVAGREAISGQLFQELRALVGADTAATLEAIVADSYLRDRGLWPTAVGATTLLVGSLGIFASLQRSLDRHRGTGSIPLEAALELVQAFFAFDAYRSFGELAQPLLAEDRSNRYLVESVAIPVAEEATVEATLVRPRKAAEAGPLPTLLEFTLDAASRDAYEAAALEYLKQKYASDRVEVIVGIGARAAMFAAKAREKVFPAASVAFGYVDRKIAPTIDFRGPATGATGTVDIRGNVELALRMVPDAKRVAFVVGAAILIDPDAVGFEINWAVVGAMAAVSVGLSAIVLRLAVKSRSRPVVTGHEQMIGMAGMVEDWSGMRGHVFVHGESWNAVSALPLSPGAPVLVTRVDGLTLTVTPASGGNS